MRVIRVKNNVFFELEKIASQKGFRISEVIEKLVEKNRTQNRVENFLKNSENSNDFLKMVGLGILFHILPKLELEDIVRLVFLYEDEFLDSNRLSVGKAGSEKDLPFVEGKEVKQ